MNQTMTIAVRKSGSVQRADAARRGASSGDGAARSIYGVLLAGTHPWGGCRLDHAIARPLLPVANRQLISYPLNWLGDAWGACVCGNSHTALIRDSLDRTSLGALALDFYADFMPRGPAGCVRDAAVRQRADLVVVIDGTVIPRFSLGELLDRHRESGAVLTVAVQRVPGQSIHGNEHVAPVGVYVFSTQAIECIAPTGYQDIKEELIPKLHEKGMDVSTYVAAEWSPRVSGADTYLPVNDWMVEDAVRSFASAGGSATGESTLIDPTARIDASARLVGPILVGPHAQIRAGAIVVGPTSIGRGAVVEAGAAVSRSALWDRCVIGESAVVDRSVITMGGRVAPSDTVRHAIHQPS